MKKIIFLFSIFFLFFLKNVSYSQINNESVNGYSPVDSKGIKSFESIIEKSGNRKIQTFKIFSDTTGFIEIEKNLASEIFLENFENFSIWNSLEKLEGDSVRIKVFILGLDGGFCEVGEYSLKSNQIGKSGTTIFHPEKIPNFKGIKIRFDFYEKTNLEISFDNFSYSFNKSRIFIDNFGDDEEEIEKEKESFLSQNYPNPFNPITTIKYEILHESFVKLTVYDAIGREVKTLIDEYFSPGEYETVFNGTDLMSGTYYYKIEMDNFVEVKKNDFIEVIA